MALKQKDRQPGTVTASGRGWRAMRGALGLMYGTIVLLTPLPGTDDITIEVISQPAGGAAGTGGGAQRAAGSGSGADAAGGSSGGRQHLSVHVAVAAKEQQLRPGDIIGHRVAIHWAGNDTHFPGTIMAFDVATVTAFFWLERLHQWRIVFVGHVARHCVC